MYTGPGGGMYTGPGGGLYSGPGGGLYSGPGNAYRAITPPWPVFIKKKKKRNLHQQVNTVRKKKEKVGYKF